MDSKKCAHCGIVKPISKYHKDKNRQYGVSRICVPCSAIKDREYRRTRNGILTTMYSNQKKSSRKRNMTLPTYTRDEFGLWLFSQENFNSIFEDWVKSGYKKEMSHSVDRIDDYKPYAFDNIRLVTWIENKSKGWSDRRNGINNKVSKAVTQIDLSGNIVNKFYSTADAGRKTNLSQWKISSACISRDIVGGYLWRFTKEVKR